MIKLRLILTIFRRICDHVREDIVSVVVDKERSWEACIKSAGQLNETAVEKSD